jgi:hypothetical protein
MFAVWGSLRACGKRDRYTKRAFRQYERSQAEDDARALEACACVVSKCDIGL